MLVALVGGRINTAHPALAAASVRYFDARSKPRASSPDDFTTGVAALLVGSGPYLGIVPRASLLVLHVLDEEFGTTSADLLAAMDAAVRDNAKVV